MKIEKLLKNQYLYYAALVLMIINVLGYVNTGAMECIIIFGVCTYFANHFTKNRTLDIFVGLFIANVVFGCGRVKEGLDENNGTIADDAGKLAAKCRQALAEKKCLVEGQEAYCEEGEALKKVDGVPGCRDRVEGGLGVNDNDELNQLERTAALADATKDSAERGD